MRINRIDNIVLSLIVLTFVVFILASNASKNKKQWEILGSVNDLMEVGFYATDLKTVSILLYDSMQVKQSQVVSIYNRSDEDMHYGAIIRMPFTINETSN